MEGKHIFLDDYKDLYTVSKNGYVISTNTGHVLKPYVRGGYPVVCLNNWKKKLKKIVPVHILVFRTYSNLEDGKVINHKDGNRLNYNFDNLEAITQSENTLHAIRLGLRHHCQKVVLQYDLNHNFIQKFESIEQASSVLGLTKDHVSHLCTGNCNPTKFILEYEHSKRIDTPNLDDNHFKVIEGYSDYYIGDGGVVFSLRRKCYLFQDKTQDGYLYVGLSKNGKQKKFLVHRLVAFAFLPKMQDADMVNHKDGNKANNDVSNLEWITHSGNMRHYYANNSSKNRKPVSQYDLEGNYIKTFASLADAATDLGLRFPTGISKTCKGQQKTAYNYIWKFNTD